MRQMTISLLAAATLTALAALPATAGGGGHGGACRAFGEGSTITMRDSCFEGTGHVVAAGATVIVRNQGQMAHTITAADGSFDSGTIAPGDTFELRVDEAGDIPVYCTLHGTADGQGMAGLLAVRAASEAQAPVTAATDPGRSPSLWVGGLAVAGLAGIAVGRRTATGRR